MAAGLFKWMVLLAVVALAAGKCSDDDELSCSDDTDHCIPIRYICDGDGDCSNREDEDEALCSAWRHSDCERGSVKCRRGNDDSCVSIQAYCTLTDPHCEGDLDLRICQMLKDKVVSPLNDIVVTSIARVAANNLERSERLGEEFSLMLNRTIEHPRCPPMFTLVGNQCLSIFFVGSVSWGEARAFCQMLEGELVTFRNVSHFAALVAHLKDAQVTGDFWVGGRYLNESLGWTWVDDGPMDLGTPYWAVRYKEECERRNVTFPGLEETRLANDGECYNYVQAPRQYLQGHCVAATFQHYYYLTDEDCLSRRSPLCVLADTGTPGHLTLGTLS